MNVIQKSDAIKAGLRKGFQDGNSKMARRKCYGYTISPAGELKINPDEATVVRWIFERYLSGDSLGRIASGLEQQDVLSPTGRPKWNREAIDKLLSNEKYTGRVMLQKTISTGAAQIENDGLMDRYLYTGTHADFVCYGYKRGDDGQLAINEPDAEIVRRIFQMRSEGKSLGAISDWLYENKVPSPTGKERWSRETISKLLRNEKYTGDVLLQKTFVKDVLTGKQFKNQGELKQYLIQRHHPIIISKELFEQANPNYRLFEY